MNQQMSQSPSWILIVNPASADGRTGRQWPENEILFRNLLPPFEAWHTTHPGQARELAQKAVDLGVTTIAVHGGDGTFNEVVNGIVNHSSAPIPLALLPSGTGADLVRTLGISHSLADAARRPGKALPILSISVKSILQIWRAVRSNGILSMSPMWDSAGTWSVM